MENGEEHEITRVAIAVDPVALVTTECITVTSAMRKHARWAHSSVSAIMGGTASVAPGREIRPSRQSTFFQSLNSRTQRTAETSNRAYEDGNSLASRWGLRGKKGKSMQDNPLMSAFARLRNDMRGCTSKFYKGLQIFERDADLLQTSEPSTFLLSYIPFYKSYALPQPLRPSRLLL